MSCGGLVGSSDPSSHDRFRSPLRHASAAGRGLYRGGRGGSNCTWFRAVTYDLDIVYDRSAANLDRLVAALAPYKPYPRGAPPGLPFFWDRQTLARGLNFTLVTSLGEIDLLGEMSGGGTYQDLLPNVVEVDMFGTHCHCLSLSQLIRAKRAAGRPRDFDALAELEAIQEEQNPPPEP